MKDLTMKQEWFKKRLLSNLVLDTIGVCPGAFRAVGDRIHTSDLSEVLKMLGSYDIDVMFTPCTVTEIPQGDLSL